MDWGTLNLDHPGQSDHPDKGTPMATRPSTLSRTERLAAISQALLFVTLVASVIYVAVQLGSAPLSSTEPGVRVRSDYALMLIQSAGGLIVMFLPTFVNRRLALHVPHGMQIAYFVFLYFAIYLGEVRSFYYRFPSWDVVMHFFGGAMLAALGFLLVGLLSEAERPRITLSPNFVAFFAFCFALACGAVWEIWEFTIDGLFGTNMQKFITDTGEVLVGREALRDTMEDLITDAAAALAVTLVGYLSLRHSQRKRPATHQPGNSGAPPSTRPESADLPSATTHP